MSLGNRRFLLTNLQAQIRGVTTSDVAHHTCNGFRGILNFSELLWNSIPNSCSSQCPGASIYRLRCRMGDCCKWTDAVRTVNLGRPDRQLCDRIFWKFCWKSFLFKIRVRTVRHWRLDGYTSAASNFHIRLSASGPRGMNFRKAILQHAISIYVMRASRPWVADVRTVELKSVRTVIFEMRFLPYLWLRPDGTPHHPDGVSIFPYSKLGKNLKLIDHWWTSGRAGEMSGRMQAGTEASRHSVGSRRKRYVVRTDDAGLSGVRSGWTRRPDG
jgi:hypothetical protein